MSQIRLNKTPELEEVLAYLRSKYRLLSEAEIIKVALAEKYAKEAKIPLVDEETEKLIAQGLEDYKKGRYTELRTDEDIDKYFDSL
ncbi:hypothetical protein A2773_07010 [Candidatus Gottesmanbacteria bacterium RIFCSPHIGHO2_01_FULL_39_10]|uniref:Antitoxin n=1 Tax=Candidatus Gottesmanbacteria bacterium RIFCSPHIGHO2_01_FULL_39_10 TaxID=1798375 RepID=A0A1F5ZRU9_9BACT|nr:MAG: hypothetical protein A2773_07010 [Candidatus Gottesmanbacteria bacterium RIFCSPHIGHO2_01_FULL_39_10]